MSLLSEINIIKNIKISTYEEYNQKTYFGKIKTESLFDYTNYQWLSDWFKDNTSYIWEDEISFLTKQNIIDFIDFCKSENIFEIINESFEDWKFIYKTKEKYINNVIDKFSKLLDIDFDNNTIYYEEI